MSKVMGLSEKPLLNEGTIKNYNMNLRVKCKYINTCILRCLNSYISVYMVLLGEETEEAKYRDENFRGESRDHNSFDFK